MELIGRASRLCYEQDTRGQPGCDPAYRGLCDARGDTRG
jgi:hypothetical protein